jgi:hypothetical protein
VNDSFFHDCVSTKAALPKRPIYAPFQIMATANTVDEINLENLKVEDSTPAAATTTKKAPKPKQDKPKQDKPKQDKPKQDKPKQDKPKPEKVQAVVEAPPEELDFNRTPQEVAAALEQWAKQASLYNKPNPNEKM